MLDKFNLIRLEQFFYLFVWFAAVFYSIFKFSITSNEYFQDYDDEYSDFTFGWAFLSRNKDISDYEWEMFKFLIEKLALWMFLSSCISKILEQYNSFVLQFWRIGITIAFILKEMGVSSLAIILIQPIFFCLIPATFSKKLVWCLNSIMLMLITAYKYFIATDENLLDYLVIDRKVAYMTIVAIFWTNLRCVSFCLDFANEKGNKPNKLVFFSYILYLPVILMGPFIPYKDFDRYENTKANVYQQCFTLFLDLFRFFSWLLLIEFSLHFIYVNAIRFHPDWLESFDSWSLYGYGYTMGQFFHMKYLVIYGLSTSFAKFEHIKVPSLPICIGRVHLYSDMWKYFDAGLYNFLLNYIFLPLMNSRMVNNRFIASFLCFVFVYIWHGTENYILIWTGCNYFGIVIENCAKAIENRYFSHLKNTISLQKLSCVLASPLLAVSAISNFYFFAHTSIGNIFLTKISNDSFLANFGLLAVLYCCCQVSTELTSKKCNKIKKNIKL